MVDGVLGGIQHCATYIVNMCVLHFCLTLGVRSDIVRIYEQLRCEQQAEKRHCIEDGICASFFAAAFAAASYRTVSIGWVNSKLRSITVAKMQESTPTGEA